MRCRPCTVHLTAKERLRALAGLLAVLALTTSVAQAQPKKLKADPPEKAVAVLTDKLAELPIPDSFFGPEVAFADLMGPFVVAGRNGDPKDSRVVFDLAEGRPVGTLSGKLPIDKPNALSPDGKLLAAGGGAFKNDTFFIYDVASGKQLHEIKSEKRVEHLEWIGPDRLISVFNWEHLYTVWDAKTGKSIKSFKTKGRHGHPAVSPGGKYLAVAEEDKHLRFYDLKTGDVLAAIALPDVKPFGYGCEALGFSADGAHIGGLFKNFNKLTILAWKLEDGNLAAEFPINDPFKNVFFNGQKFQWSPDGQAWLVNGELVIDRQSGKTIWKCDPAFNGPCRIVALNQVLGFSEKNRKRFIVSAGVTKEQVDGMVKVVRSGGQAADALLPKLTEADLAAGKPIDVPIGGVAVTYKPDAAGDASKLAMRPIPLKLTGKDIEALHFPSPETAAVVIEMKPPEVAPFQPSPKSTGLERYDLTTGKQLGRFEFKFPAKCSSVSADGKQVLLVEAEVLGRLDLWNWQGDAPTHVAGWRPYAKEGDEKNRKVTFAAVTGPNRVLTANALGRIASWKLPECKAEWVAEVPSFTGLRLSPGGKYLVGLDRDVVRLFDVATGMPSGDLTVPANFPAGRREPKAVAIRSDAKEASGLWLVHPEGSATGPEWAVARWDLPSGKTIDSFAFRAFIGGNPPAFNYAGTGFLLADHTHLIDLGRKEVTWTYRLASFEGKHAANPPDARHWYAMADFNQPTATLVAAMLPEDSVPKYVKTIAVADALVKPGTAISVEPQLKGDQADRIRDTAVANAQKALEAAGLKAGNGGGLVLRLDCEERDTGDRVEFRNMFPNFRESPFARTEVKLMEVTSRATLTLDGKAIWQSQPARHGMRTIGIVTLPKGENDVGRYLRQRMWDNVAGWAANSAPPRWITNTADGVLALPGNTQLKSDGPTTLPPRVQVGK